MASLNKIIKLPQPGKISGLTVEEALLLRRSIRDFRDEPVKLRDLALILWATYGLSDPVEGFLTTPSAGATYPLQVYVVVGSRSVIDYSEFLDPGVYRYDPERHVLILVRSGDVRRELMQAALMQGFIGRAPVSIVITAVYERTTSVYGERGRTRYVPMEAGHASENAYLMTTALGYGTVAVGAFRDSEVSQVIGIGGGETPLYIMPIGVPITRRKIVFEELAGFFTERR
ncbi:SagB/ThcOx family dehydrogenase [Desulfurococcus amylolyticus]|uniref:SagB/ThcOx family dehydrogenase n=1 Tax=Desulfurococcus amylolyticus TaxID=94694 RepID=UPI0023F06F70|nr:SagB/ThcOx family dehydrogenase [Desulfurococcus amylolyticus]